MLSAAHIDLPHRWFLISSLMDRTGQSLNRVLNCKGPEIGEASRRTKAGSLEVAYLDAGPGDGWPGVMCHGFPYDVHAFAEAASRRRRRARHHSLPPRLRSDTLSFRRYAALG